MHHIFIMLASLVSKPSLLFEVMASRLLIAIFGDVAPSDTDWSKYLESVATLDEVSVLALSRGGGPTLRQRQQLEATLGDRSSRAAIVTTSRAAREIVAAIRWFDRDIQAFAPAEWKQALEFLGIEETESTRITARLRMMAARMGELEFKLG